MLKRVTTLSLRVVIITLLMLSFFDVKIPAKSNKLCRIYAIDLSDSVASESKSQDAALAFIKWDITNLKPDDLIGIITFAERANVIVSPVAKSNFTLPNNISIKEKYGTNIQNAIQTALGLFPDEYIKEIYLFTDGVATTGDLQKALFSAKAKSVIINTIPIGFAQPNDVKIIEANAPSHVNEGERFDITATIYSTKNTKAKVIIKELGLAQEVNLTNGGNTKITFTDISINTPLQVFTIECDKIDDCPQNNIYYVGTIKNTSKPRILYLSQDNASTLLTLLKENKNIEITASTSYQEPFPYSCIVIDNVAASKFTTAQMQNIKKYVEFGGGLLFVGGPSSFALGGYEKTPVEEALPLWMSPDERYSLAYVLDTSGSMSAQATENKRKIDLARDAIESSLNILKESDLVSVFTFSNLTQQLLQLTPVSRKEKVVSSLANAKAFGPTYILPALDAALKELTNSDTNHRHIILITDGKTNEELYKFKEMSQRLQKSNVSITAIAVGKDIDEDKLKTLGNYKHILDIMEVENAIKGSILRSKELILEKKLDVKIANQFDFSISSVPSIAKCNRTSTKKTAQLLLTTDEAPLLAIWNFGKGKASALATSLNPEWAGEMARWDELYTFINRLISYLARPFADIELKLEHKIEDASIELNATAKRDADLVNGINIYAEYINTVTNKSGVLQLEQIGSGKYKGIIKDISPGAYFITLSTETSSQTDVVSMPYPLEYRNIGIDYAALEYIAASTGGKVIYDFNSYKESPRKEIKAKVSGLPYFVGMALTLFALDIIISIFWK